MAFTASKKHDGVDGALKTKVYECDFTSVTTGHIATGLNIVYASFTNNTTEGDGLMKQNRDSGDSTAERGGLYFSGFTANDKVFVEVKGY